MSYLTAEELDGIVASLGGSSAVREGKSETCRVVRDLLEMRGRMANVKSSVVRSARDAARALRDVAARLEAGADAAEAGDFGRLAEVSISMDRWSVDQIRGAALMLWRSEP